MRQIKFLNYSLLLLIGLLPLGKAAESCPAGATGTSVRPQLSIFLRGSALGVAGGTIGSCQQLELQAALVYQPDCPGGLTCVSFSDGVLGITEIINHADTGLYLTNVLGVSGKPNVPLIGPTTDPVNCPGAQQRIDAGRVLYTLTPANIAAGRV